jgi:DNA-binding response OmpR family regulator
MSTVKVLVIDDNKAHGEGLAELLELSGFQAYHAATGRQGLDLAVRESVHAVLLDLNLPDMSGYEVCLKLREGADTAKIAIVFHTGSAAPAGMDHGADAFLTYPIEMRHICDVILGSIARRNPGVVEQRKEPRSTHQEETGSGACVDSLGGTTLTDLPAFADS